MNYKPNFLGIGSVRGGSTWLHTVLSSHPQFLLPRKRKEIQFFTKYWEKETDWYYDCFRDAAEARSDNDFKHIGEITPGYLIAPHGPSRIAQLEHIEKLVLILRNPIDRVFSHYRWHLRVTGEELSFEEFCQKLERISIGNSLYCKNINRYLQYFDLEQLLILTFEDVKRSPETIFSELGHFFDVDPLLFEAADRVNQSTIPKYRKLFNTGHKVADFCRKRDIDWLPNLAIRLGGKKVLEAGGSSQDNQTITTEQREYLYPSFKSDIEALEGLTGKDFSQWKMS